MRSMVEGWRASAVCTPFTAALRGAMLLSVLRTI